MVLPVLQGGRRRAITIRQLLSQLSLFLLVLIIFFSATTLFAYYTQQAHWQQQAVNWHRVLQLLDLRDENTLATWFSSILFLTASVGFVLLGWGKSKTYTINFFSRFSFQVTALALCALSADEVGSFHETVGSWFERKVIVWDGLQGMGFSWLLIFAPFALAILILCGQQLYKLINTLPDLSARRYSRALLILACILLPSVLILEALQGYWIFTKQGETVFTCLEEMFELLGMYSLFLVTLIIARQHQL
ncbi:hypothetical protein [Candidatus Albibeggiatoa sp. nov. NOAA]|uniref:hypothetical protein n=1 Tax=Candidatus Albibeggiatoa sp. nov. NOAA TaxID=3162724 RepID=UPI0032F4FBC3|nr:hypothetical protein [Thiotrichaceae bacterium]